MRTRSHYPALGLLVCSLTACSGAGLQSTGDPALAPTSATLHNEIRFSVLSPMALLLSNMARAAKPVVDTRADVKGSRNAVIVSDPPSETIDIFSSTGKITGVISQGISYPQGLATDQAQNLYVANTGDSNVLEFSKPYKSAPTVYNDGNDAPADVAVTYDGDLIGVTNISTEGSGQGDVVFFKKGHASPCATVTSPDWGEMFFAGFDRSGDLFIDGLQTSVGPVLLGEVKGGCRASAIVTLTTPQSISYPGGVQVQRDGRVSYEDQDGNLIYTYAAPNGPSLGAPILTTPLSGAKYSVCFAFTKNAKNVWTTAPFSSGGLMVPEFAFPTGGSPINNFTGPISEPLGIAVNPTYR